MAGEWFHPASLAIRATVPVAVLREQVPQFSGYSEGFQVALENLRYLKET